MRSTGRVSGSRTARGLRPRAPVPIQDQPHALTFFLTGAQRRRVLDALGVESGRHITRSAALLRALRISNTQGGER